MQRLALHLTGWQATTFLVGEYEPSESHSNPIFTIADGIIWLTQTVERNASVRRHAGDEDARVRDDARASHVR